MQMNPANIYGADTYSDSISPFSCFMSALFLVLLCAVARQMCENDLGMGIIMNKYIHERERSFSPPRTRSQLSQQGGKTNHTLRY
jgi:hypothetical protein